ncbi:hypothetical protein NDU88_006430 [Pleurodeles waltl]|uniref:Uncharacterized protein n=1 Tax=Pleurodeles waltl TaxID=8319 RepID=A0AAV7TXM5_PLEWA|nr:hypothetical protein NDU88_006430 [Pleurodeles waltl]
MEQTVYRRDRGAARHHREEDEETWTPAPEPALAISPFDAFSAAGVSGCKGNPKSRRGVGGRSQDGGKLGAPSQSSVIRSRPGAAETDEDPAVLVWAAGDNPGSIGGTCGPERRREGARRTVMELQSCGAADKMAAAQAIRR